MAASSLAAAPASASAPSSAAEEHPLRHTYQFTFLLKGQPAVANVEYDQRIQPMGKFSTVRTVVEGEEEEEEEEGEEDPR